MPRVSKPGSGDGKASWLRRAAAVLLLSAAYFGAMLSARLLFEERVGSIDQTGPRRSVARVDHSTWDDLLHKYVDADGRVDYRFWKSSPVDFAKLKIYLADAGNVDRSISVDARHETAYWINLYNALTVFGILERYPTDSILDHVHRFGFHFWKDLRLGVGGQWVSLDAIEHQFLRKLGDPRIHFAIVCASTGCPRLRNEAYDAARLDEQLADNARHFFSQDRNIQVDATARVVRLSPILDWFAEDFGATVEEYRRTIASLAGPPAAELLVSSPPPKITYLKYDWRLNDRARPVTQPE